MSKLLRLKTSWTFRLTESLALVRISKAAFAAPPSTSARRKLTAARMIPASPASESTAGVGEWR